MVVKSESYFVYFNVFAVGPILKQVKVDEKDTINLGTVLLFNFGRRRHCRRRSIRRFEIFFHDVIIFPSWKRAVEDTVLHDVTSNYLRFYTGIAKFLNTGVKAESREYIKKVSHPGKCVL